jgi:hypothetical protein
MRIRLERVREGQLREGADIWCETGSRIEVSAFDREAVSDEDSGVNLGGSAA